MRTQVQTGFTLVELMIVVAIVGILAAIAVPAYQNYTIRAQVTEGLSLASGIQTAVADYYAHNGFFPAGSVTTAAPVGVGLPAAPAGKYAVADLLENGAIQVTYSGSQANSALSAGPSVLGLRAATAANGDLIWICGTAAVPASATTAAADPTAAMNPQWLPASCR